MQVIRSCTLYVTDYGFYKLEVKTKTSTDIEFKTNVSSNHDSGKFMGTLETKFEWKDYGKWSCKFCVVCHILRVPARLDKS